MTITALGKVLGLATVPQTWLTEYASLSSAGTLSAISVVNAVQAGLFALLASAGGAATHGALAKHVDLPKYARMNRAGAGPSKQA